MIESMPKKNNFESKKEEFYIFCKKYIDDVYNEIENQSLERFQLGFDFIEEKIDILLEEGSKDNLYEKEEFVEIFVKTLKDKSEEIFFNEDYDKEKEYSFHSYFYNNFFSMSPNLTSYLSSDFFAYIKLQGELIHSGVLDYVTQAVSGEIVLSLHDIDIDSIAEKIENISISQKILFIKTLGDSARRAIASGDWAYDVYKKIDSFFEKISKQENVPLLDYILKYQLSLMKEGEARFHDLSIDENLIDFRQERINFFNEVYHEDMTLSEEIHLDQKDSVFHKNLKLTSISKDYIAIINGIDTSVALVNDSEKNISSYKEITRDKAELVSLLHSPEITWLINNEFNIDVRNMYLDEQVQFLDYLSSLKNEKWKRLEDILKNKDIKKEYILRSFLSLDLAGRDFGDTILSLGETLQDDLVKKIFKKYSELVNISHEIEAFIEKEFSGIIAKDSDVVEQVKNKLLHKGVDIIKRWGDTVKILGFEGSQSVSSEDVISDLNKVSAEAIATLSTFKYSRRNGFNLSLEDIKHSEFSKKNIEDISKDEREEMIGIYLDNYADNPKLAKQLVDKFENAFRDVHHNEFYLFKLNGKINAFVRFEQNGNGRFASALNVSKELHGFALGEAMMEQALKKEAENNILYAEANLSQWNTSRYLKLGFNAISENTNYKVPAVNIEWNNIENEKYLSKNITQEDIISGNYNHSLIIVEKYKDIADFDRSRLGDLIMTHFIYNKEDNNYYVVLEEKK